MYAKSVRFSFSETGLDTIMYLLEKEEKELKRKKLVKGELDQIDSELLYSIKSCEKVINSIEEKRNKTKGKSAYEAAKKKTRSHHKKQA